MVDTSIEFDLLITLYNINVKLQAHRVDANHHLCSCSAQGRLPALLAGRTGTRGLIANPNTAMPVHKRPPITASTNLRAMARLLSSNPRDRSRRPHGKTLAQEVSSTPTGVCLVSGSENGKNLSGDSRTVAFRQSRKRPPPRCAWHPPENGPVARDASGRWVSQRPVSWQPMTGVWRTQGRLQTYPDCCDQAPQAAFLNELRVDKFFVSY